MHKNVFVVRYLWQDGIALFGNKIPGYSVSLLAQIFSRHRHTYHTHALTHALVFVYMYSCMYVCGRQWVNWRASDIPRARPHTHKNTHVHMHTSPPDGVAAWNELASMILTYTCTHPSLDGVAARNELADILEVRACIRACVRACVRVRVFTCKCVCASVCVCVCV